MSPVQTAQRLARAFQTLQITVTATGHDTTITAPRHELDRAAVQLQRGERTYSMMRAEGVLRRQMVTHSTEDAIVFLVPEAMRLIALLEECAREADRAAKLRRGIIPGALSAREATDLIRRGYFHRS